MGDKPQKQIRVSTPMPVGGLNVDIKRVNKVQDEQQKALPKKPEPTVADLTPPSIDDPQIDKVIDDIVMSESNEVLAAEDAMYIASKEQRPKKKKKLTFKRVLKSKWTYISLVIIILALLI